MTREELFESKKGRKVFLTEAEAVFFAKSFIRDYKRGYAFYYKDLVKPKTLFKPEQYIYRIVYGIKPYQKKEAKQHLWRKRINREK